MGGVAPVAVGRVRGVGLLLAWGRSWVVLVWRVLQVGRRVVVVVMVVRWRVLGHVAELGVVNGHRRVCLRPGGVVQVGGVGGVGDQGGVHGLRGGAGRLHPPASEQRPEQRGGAGQGLAAVAGRAVSAGGGSPPHVRTANDGPLLERRQSDRRKQTARATQNKQTNTPPAPPPTDDLIAACVAWCKSAISFSGCLVLFVVSLLTACSQSAQCGQIWLLLSDG